MRRRLALAALALPASIAALAYGCTPKAPSVQDFCGFLDDPQNCYQRFFNDIGALCGAEGEGKGPLGTFLSRDKPDKCILEKGGAVTFDKPLNLESYPPTSISFTVLDDQGVTCGSFHFGGPYDLIVNVPTLKDGGVLNDGGHACPDVPEIYDGVDDAGKPIFAYGNGAAEGVVCGGALTVANPEGDFVDMTCPNGETHHFISLQLDHVEDGGTNDAGVAVLKGCVDDETKKPLRDSLVSYKIDGKPGGIGVPGKLTVSATYPDGRVIEFFQCTIPEAVAQCCNGIKDGTEADVDCGGSPATGPTACDRCLGTKVCIVNSDCESKMCVVSPDTGIKACSNPAAIPTSNCEPPAPDMNDAGTNDAGDGGP